MDTTRTTSSLSTSLHVLVNAEEPIANVFEEELLIFNLLFPVILNNYAKKRGRNEKDKVAASTTNCEHLYCPHLCRYFVT